MKHFSPTALDRAARLWPPAPLHQTEDDLKVELRARLVAADDKHALARELGVSPFQLTGILRGRWPIDDRLAAALGYRRITRFERIE